MADKNWNCIPVILNALFGCFDKRYEPKFRRSQDPKIDYWTKDQVARTLSDEGLDLPERKKIDFYQKGWRENGSISETGTYPELCV